jgi:hypothetical protein
MIANWLSISWRFGWLDNCRHFSQGVGKLKRCARVYKRRRNRLCRVGCSEVKMNKTVRKRKGAEA